MFRAIGTGVPGAARGGDPPAASASAGPWVRRRVASLAFPPLPAAARLLVAVGALMALAAVPAGAGTETRREQSERVIDAQGIRSIRVENSRGLVRVRGGEGGRIRITALKIVRAPDPDRSTEFARETEVATDLDRGNLVVRVRYPQREAVHVSLWQVFSGCELPKVEVRLGLEVPDGLPLTLVSTSGDLETEGVSGSQDLRTTSGDVAVRGARGRVEASSTSGSLEVQGIASARLQTVSGDVKVEGSHGALEATSTSGDIIVGGSEDSLSLATVSGEIHAGPAPRGLVARTTSGAIVARSAAGLVRIETASGDVSVSLENPLRRADITTGSGDIDARLGPSVGCAIDMRTSNGSLDLSTKVAVKNVTRHLVTGVVNGGTAPVVLRTSSGDIRVRSGE